MTDEKIQTIIDRVQKEADAYESTFGELEISLDDMFFSDKYRHTNDYPTNALIEITVDGKTARATIPVEDLLAKAEELKLWIDKANYPRWLDERPAHMLSDGTLIRVEEVRFHPEHGMFATVTIFDRNMQPHGQSTVEITGKTDRKALARKIFTDGQNIQEKIGYVIWRLGV